MQWRPKRSKRRFIVPTITITVIVVIVAAVTIFLLNLHRIDEFVLSKPPTSKTLKSEFSFGGADHWWQGTTSHTSMELFSTDASCYVSVEHQEGTLNVADELQKQVTALKSVGYVVTPGIKQPMTVLTVDGTQSYTLQEYDVTSGGNANKSPYGGQEFGYYPVTGGYLEIMGYCNTSAQLQSTYSTLQAIRYDAR